MSKFSPSIGRAKTTHPEAPTVERLELRQMLSATVSVTQTNLASDLPGLVANPNPAVKNAWGISYGPTTPFWISENDNSNTTLFDGNGNQQALVVNIPGAGGQPSAPTGQVFNTDPAGFKVTEGTKTPASSVFIFAGEDGGISGWNPGIDRNNAIPKVDQSKIGSVFKGLTQGTVGTNTYLYATDFHNNAVDVYDSNWQLQNWTGAFQDSRIRPGFAPFNVQNIGGDLFVTYAKQNAVAHDDVAGPGNGFVDEYDTSGNLIRRFDHVGALNSPWGVAQVPNSSTWGPLANDILVGQFGSGQIAIYNTNGDFQGTLRGPDHHKVVIDGLWALKFGGGGPINAAGAHSNGDVNTLYFTAGPNSEADGLFGSLTPHVTQGDEHGNPDQGNHGGDNGDNNQNDGSDLDDLLDHLKH